MNRLPIVAMYRLALPLLAFFALPAMQAASASWTMGKETEDAARAEAKVVIYAAPGHVNRDAQDAIRQVFHKKYGVSIDWTTMSPQAIPPRVMAERRTGQSVVDIVMSGLGSSYAQLKAVGYVERILAPSTLEQGVWRLDPATAVPNERDWLFINMPLQSSLLINTNLVPAGEEPKSYNDLLLPKWKGKIVLQRPWVGGTGSGWYRATHSALGEKYMKALAKQVVLAVNVNDPPDAVARGRFAIAIAASPQRVRQLVNEGAPIQPIHPKEGSHLSVNGVMLITGAPHPSAGKLFLNWFYTKQGQQVYAPKTLAISVRRDVSQDYLAPGERYVEGEPFLIPTAEDFSPKSAPKLRRIAKEIFEGEK